MDRFYVGLISFAVGFLLCYFLLLNSIKVVKVESNGEEINSALVTLDIENKEFLYYMGE